MLRSDNMLEVLDPEVRRTKYSELLTSKIIPLLEKFRETKKKNKKSERQVIVESVIRGLQSDL